MRKSTLASLLILCGSTAALAQMTAAPGDPMQNNTMDNGAAEDASPAWTGGDTTGNVIAGNAGEPM